MSDVAPEVTRYLNLAAQGDAEAERAVYPFIFEELRKLAQAARHRLPAGETYHATALVNEAYLRVAARQEDSWQGRAQFFFVAARAMRDILVEQARRKQRVKRGGDVQHVDVDEVEVAVESSIDVLELNEALEKLRVNDPDGHQIAMLRYFTGLSVPEVAETLSISVSTVERKWRFLRSWFAHELGVEGQA